ncbi:hypothetical protein NPIL_491281 [Nephila pilipes]|uniref:Uncharacterized protein n=1 Tax=Nephila pilipes TaxID=299642 RepID=A0A8X6UTH0_NEPPI|nr:hypothetical protein NPIL_491281 [Nephila pilipes]
MTDRRAKEGRSGGTSSNDAMPGGVMVQHSGGRGNHPLEITLAFDPCRLRDCCSGGRGNKVLKDCFCRGRGGERVSGSSRACELCCLSVF